MTDKIYISHRTWVYVGLFTAFLLRMFNLNYEGLWNDELFTAFSANPEKSLQFTIDYLAGDVHPPLHNIISKYWAFLFGYNDTSLRMLNVVFGVIGVLAVYQITKLLFTKRIALFALWLAAVNSFLIRYSQEVRAYMLLFVLATYSYYYLVKVLREPTNRKNVLLYVLFTAATLYTHYFGLFVMASQGVIVLCLMDYSKFRKRVGVYTLMFLAPVVLFSPWIPYFIEHSKQPFVWLKKAEWTMIFRYPEEFFNDVILSTATVLFLFILILYFTIRKFKTLNKLEDLLGKHYRALLILVLWIVVYFGIPFARSFFSTSNMNYRYFIVIVCPLLILLAFLINLLKNRKTANTVLFVILIYSAFTIALRSEPYYQKRNLYRDIVEDASFIESKTPILFLTSRPRNFIYYLRQNNFNKIYSRIKDFSPVIEKESPKEYTVFIDLQFKDSTLDSLLKENKLQYPGYELVREVGEKNSYNIVTARLLHFKLTENKL